MAGQAMHSSLQAEHASESIRQDTASNLATVMDSVPITAPTSKLLSVLSSHFAKVREEEARKRAK